MIENEKVWHFTVDAKLLRELGERLVGKPSVALSELIKNSYDADATLVKVEFNPQDEEITVSDDGCGMTAEEFVKYWMRVGSTHKEAERISNKFRRPMTGSKGVGRLAAQFLAWELELETTSEKTPEERLRVKVNWKEAVQAGDLTEAKATYQSLLPSPDYKKGTTITLRGMRNKWKSRDVEKLAREVWWLQPPFRSMARGEGDVFSIVFESSNPDFEAAFQNQMGMVMDLWEARLVGRNQGGRVKLACEFRGEEKPVLFEYSIEKSDDPDVENLKGGEFEIRIFDLRGKLTGGIRVDAAREYMRTWGGVHVYDAGFRLPYYGNPQNDWLRIQLDHARRTSLSELLPAELNVPGGMEYLPTLSRVFGVVTVNTGQEPGLDISITRDRLLENKAFDDLKYMVRYALDIYAVEKTKRVVESKRRKTSVKRPEKIVEEIGYALEGYRGKVDNDTYEAVTYKVKEATAAVKEEFSIMKEKLSVLAPLATAGMASLAYQHEQNKQFATVDMAIRKLSRIKGKDETADEKIASIQADLSSWLERAKATNALFSFLSEPENVKNQTRLDAKRTVDTVLAQIRFFARGVEVSTEGIRGGLLLPPGTFAEWSSIFQNVLINAINAVNSIDGSKKIDMVSVSDGAKRSVIVRDTGCGVDLSTSGELFEPFVRHIELSDEKKRMGYGGTGLGLAIVKLIAERIGCKVEFVEPDPDYRTAFSISWEEENE